MLTNPRTLPRGTRSIGLVDVSSSGPDKPIRSFGVFSKFLTPPHREDTSDSEPSETVMNVENTSSEAPTAVESDQESSVHPRSALAQT